jgi:hypothetical protein
MPTVLDTTRHTDTRQVVHELLHTVFHLLQDALPIVMAQLLYLAVHHFEECCTEAYTD